MPQLLPLLMQLTTHVQATDIWEAWNGSELRMELIVHALATTPGSMDQK